MARSRLLSLLVGLLSALAFATSVPRDVDQPANAPRNILSSPITRSPHEEARRDARRAMKRQSDDDIDLEDYKLSSFAYLLDIKLGSPHQPVKVLIDTGSSELWVNPKCKSAGSPTREAECSSSGKYKDDSHGRTGNSIEYEFGEARFSYVRDEVALPGFDKGLKDVQFGVATSSNNLTYGVLGLGFGNGYRVGGMAYDTGDIMTYNSVMDELFYQNFIRTRTVSIALGATNNSEVLTFGSVDTKKFTGDLHSEPILGPQNGEDIRRYWVNLSKVAITTEGEPRIYPQEGFPVIFDTGTTLSYLPKELVKALAEDFNANADEDGQLWVVPCDQEGTLQFTFGDYTIDVAMENFVWEMPDGKCLMGAAAHDDDDDRRNYILGASFLRSVYTVYDLDSETIHFAPYSECGTELQLISEENAAAQFKGECSASSRYAAGRAPMWLPIALVATCYIAGPLL